MLNLVVRKVTTSPKNVTMLHFMLVAQNVFVLHCQMQYGTKPQPT